MLSLRRCKPLCPFPPAEGLAFNLSICGSWDCFNLKRAVCPLPACTLLPYGSLWLRDSARAPSALWPPRHFCLSLTVTQEKGRSEESLWFISFPIISAGRLFGLLFKIVWGVLMKVGIHLKSSPVLHVGSFCSLGVCCACSGLGWVNISYFSGALCSKYLLIPVLSGTMKPSGFMHPLYLIFVVQMEFEAQIDS